MQQACCRTGALARMWAANHVVAACCSFRCQALSLVCCPDKCLISSQEWNYRKRLTVVFNRAGKETYFFLFQPQKGKAHESPFQEVLPKLATLRKKVQRDLLKFLCVRYLLQNYRAGAHQETFQCAKAACSRAQWGLCHCDFLFL